MQPAISNPSCIRLPEISYISNCIFLLSCTALRYYRQPSEQKFLKDLSTNLIISIAYLAFLPTATNGFIAGLRTSILKDLVINLAPVLVGLLYSALDECIFNLAMHYSDFTQKNKATCKEAGNLFNRATSKFVIQAVAKQIESGLIYLCWQKTAITSYSFKISINFLNEFLGNIFRESVGPHARLFKIPELMIFTSMTSAFTRVLVDNAFNALYDNNISVYGINLASEITYALMYTTCKVVAEKCNDKFKTIYPAITV